MYDENAWEDLKCSFIGSDLPLPPVPEDLSYRMKKDTRWGWSTPPHIREHPYNIMPFMQKAIEKPRLRFALIAHAGHCCNSYAMHYYLVDPALALFVQIPWGGIYMDNRECIREMGKTFRLCAKLQRLVEKRGPASGRFIVVESAFCGSRWAWQVGKDGRQSLFDTFERQPGAGSWSSLSGALTWHESSSALRG